MSGTAFSIPRKFNAITSVLVAFTASSAAIMCGPGQYAHPECQWNDSVFQVSSRQQGAINVRNDQTYSVANSGATNSVNVQLFSAIAVSRV